MTDTAPQTVEQCVELAKRAFALRKYEEAVEQYATALEKATEQYGAEDAPELADLYLSYGKALLENAISTSDVLGKNGEKDGPEPEGEIDPAKAGKLFSFSGDGDEEDLAVDLFAQAAKAVAEADAAEAQGEGQGEDDEDEEDDGEPEDDFNAAWDALELARSIYEKRADEGELVRLALADTLISLGDVSLETEKFEQAITDYSAGLQHKKDLLPLSSRQIAEAHYKLSMVLDLTSGRLSDAIMHAQLALESVEARLAQLHSGLATAPDAASTSATPVLKPEDDAMDAKGKGKAKDVTQDEIANLSKSQIESEIKELEGLKEDLALKVNELKTSPNELHADSAPELAEKALDQELNGTGASSAAPVQVNDLSGMVKKKKKPAAAEPAAGPTSGAEKRKADDDGVATPPEKKARLEEPGTSV
ncbi:hypothetical protein PENSPDRAFT_657515 [Peniophora sp. CONT]|nr:hypothetical protein PENSPDRAFT_657515 [Peniophora sp. CONT]